MKLIDLTHTFKDKMPVYPGDPIPEIRCIADIDSAGYTDYQVTTGMHAGTHMDAPLHMIKGGERIFEIPVKKFFGRGVLIDARGKDLVDESLLDDAKLQAGDIVLVLTGFSQFYNEAKYHETYPEISAKFAELLVAARVSIVGMDTPSPDRPPFPVHKILLGNGVLIIENLCNLEALIGVESFSVYALPAKLDTEAAPTRVIAEVGGMTCFAAHR